MFVVVSDLFSNEYNGGAELSTDSLISHTDKKVIKIKSKDVNVHHVSLYKRPSLCYIRWYVFFEYIEGNDSIRTKLAKQWLKCIYNWPN